MTTRTRQETVVFNHSFHIEGIDRALPAGSYEIVTDEEVIEGLSFMAYRRVATSLMVTGSSTPRMTTERFAIDPVDLREALRIDASS